MKKKYIAPTICSEQMLESSMIAASAVKLNQTPTNIDGLTNGGIASDGDEAGVKANEDWDGIW